MLPGPTNVPERVTRAMVTPSINHRSDDFVELYEECVNNTKKIFEKGFIELADVPFNKPLIMMQQLPALLKLKSYISVYSLVSSYI